MEPINKLIELADKLDRITSKYADFVDKLVVTAGRNEDFSDLMTLFDKTKDEDADEFFEPDNEVLVKKPLTQIPEEVEILTPIEDPFEKPSAITPSLDKQNPEVSGADKTTNLLPGERLSEIKRRHELMKLKKQLEELEKREAEEESAEKSFEDEGEDKEELSETDKVKDMQEFYDSQLSRPAWSQITGLTSLSPEDEDSFDTDEAINEADDESVLEMLKDKLKQVPDLAKKLYLLIKDNPELLEMLAL